MKVVLVDDSYEKVVEIRAVIDRLPTARVEFEHVTNASDARRLLRQTACDLLLLDLNLPDSLGSAPVDEGGLELFSLLQLDEDVKLPTEVLFITGKEGLAPMYVDRVRSLGAELCSFEPDNNDWIVLLEGKLRFLLAKWQRQHPKVDVAIIAALREPELTAILNLPFGWESRRFGGDPTTYHFGQVETKNGLRAVVAASAQRKGMPSSATLASRMVLLFRPSVLAMVGVCAGVKGKVEIGDVIVADPTWDWGSGKHVEKDGVSSFEYSPYQRPLDPMMSQAIVELSHDPSVMAAIAAEWRKPAPANSPSVRLGPMASGASVLADATKVSEINGQNRDMIGLDMEGYAVMAAAEYCPRLRSIVVKSVCDFADPAKNSNEQPYAAFLAARFLERILGEGILD